MSTYQEQKEKKKVYVLILDNEVLGAFGNLKKLCDFGLINDSDFPSYWTLTRKKEDRITFGNYIIQRVKLY